MYKAIKRKKLVEGQPISVCIDTGAEACGKNPTEKGVIRTGEKLYRPPLPSTYKETEILEDLNDGTERVLKYYGIYLKQAKEPLPPRDDVMEFYVRTSTKEYENNLKLQGFPSDLQEKFKDVVTE